MLARLSRLTMPVLILAVALLFYRLAFVSSTSNEFTVPADRNLPWTIEPLHDEPLVATDQQLKAVLAQVRPPLNPVNTNNWIHALRLWGTEAKFDDPQLPSGETMRNYFLDDAVFRQYAGENTPPLFNITPEGLLVRGFDDDYDNTVSSSYHADDLLATLAETGTPLDTVIHTRHGDSSVRTLLQTAMRSFHLDRHEYEWSMISYARYLYPVEAWKNKYGQVISVDEMVNEMIEHPLFVGPCNGLHRMEAMVVLYRADEFVGKLSPFTKKRMLNHMVTVSQLLAQSQSSEGSWTRRWPEGALAVNDQTTTHFDKILVTGHHLEWTALAPEQVLPPREHIIRASQWLVTALQEVSPDELSERYGPLSHSARALCLWRGEQPYAVWKRVQNLHDQP